MIKLQTESKYLGSLDEYIEINRIFENEISPNIDTSSRSGQGFMETRFYILADRYEKGEYLLMTLSVDEGLELDWCEEGNIAKSLGFEEFRDRLFELDRIAEETYSD